MKKIALLLVCLAAPAVAQPRPKAKDQPAPKSIVFTEGDSVFGDLASGEGAQVVIDKHRPVGNLHGIRKHFRPEMLKTAENL